MSKLPQYIEVGTTMSEAMVLAAIQRGRRKAESIAKAVGLSDHRTRFILRELESRRVVVRRMRSRRVQGCNYLTQLVSYWYLAK